MNLARGTLPVTAVVALLVGLSAGLASYYTTEARADAAETLATEAARRVNVVEREQAVARAEREEQARDLAEHAIQAQRSLDRIENMLRELREALIDQRTAHRRRR